MAPIQFTFGYSYSHNTHNLPENNGTSLARTVTTMFSSKRVNDLTQGDLMWLFLIEFFQFLFRNLRYKLNGLGKTPRKCISGMYSLKINKLRILKINIVFLYVAPITEFLNKRKKCINTFSRPTAFRSRGKKPF